MLTIMEKAAKNSRIPERVEPMKASVKPSSMLVAGLCARLSTCCDAVRDLSRRACHFFMIGLHLQGKSRP